MTNDKCKCDKELQKVRHCGHIRRTHGFLKMEDLSSNDESITTESPLLVQYRAKLPFRVTVNGQTDSSKTRSIIRCWLGGRISCQLQHCIYCSNGRMSDEEKQRLKNEFIDKVRVGMPQRLFPLN